MRKVAILKEGAMPFSAVMPAKGSLVIISILTHLKLLYCNKLHITIFLRLSGASYDFKEIIRGEAI